MIIMKEPGTEKKPTTLKDDAAIYQKREPKSERQKFSEMKTFSDKIKYIRMYYLRTGLLFALIFALLIYLIYVIVSPKDTSLMRVAFVDYQFSSELTNTMMTDFMESENITLDEHEILEFDGTTYQISNSYDHGSATVLATHIMAREIDIFIAPESTFQSYAFNGMIGSLTEILPSDIYSALADSFFLSKVKQEDEIFENAYGDDFVLGIYLDETPFWEEYSQYVNSEERPVIGIVANSKNRDMAISFLRFVFGLSSR